MIVNSSFRTQAFVVHEVVTPTDDIFVECVLYIWTGIRRTKKPCEISFVVREEEDRIFTRKARTGYEQHAPERRMLGFESIEVEAANASLGLVILIRTTPRPYVAEPERG